MMLFKRAKNKEKWDQVFWWMMLKLNPQPKTAGEPLVFHLMHGFEPRLPVHYSLEIDPNEAENVEEERTKSIEARTKEQSEVCLKEKKKRLNLNLRLETP